MLLIHIYFYIYYVIYRVRRKAGVEICCQWELFEHPGKLAVPTNLTLQSLTPELKFIRVSS
jgi:hypothetical protein